MSNDHDFINDATAALRPIIEAAYNAGREEGYRIASEQMRQKLVGLLSEGEGPAAAPDKALIIPAASEDEGRAAQGTVKPTILALVNRSPLGLTVDDVVTATGIKRNSVRGTLWLLTKDTEIIKSGNKWFPKTNEPPAEKP